MVMTMCAVHGTLCEAGHGLLHTHASHTRTRSAAVRSQIVICLIMEHCDGGDLWEKIAAARRAQTALEPATVAGWALQVRPARTPAVRPLPRHACEIARCNTTMPPTACSTRRVSPSLSPRCAICTRARSCTATSSPRTSSSQTAGRW